MAKKIILPKLCKSVSIRSDICSNLDGSIESAVKYLTEIKHTYQSDYDAIELESSYMPYDGGYELAIIGKTYETDDEYEKRKTDINSAIKKQKADKLAAERKLYEDLKAKFENK